MSDPVWPSTLPKPLKAGYSGSVTPNVIETPMESGPSRVSLIDNLPEIIYPVPVNLTDDEHKIFLGFWRDVLAYGILWMSMPHYIDGELQSKRCRIVGGVFNHDASTGINAVSFTVEIESL